MNAAPKLPRETPDNRLIHWFRPTEDLSNELVLSGPCSLAIEVLARELRQTERFVEAGIDPSTKVLFSGPSGTGKTLAARWLGWSLRAPLAVVDVSSAINAYLGETAKNIAGVFAAATKEKALLFFDEIDAVCKRRSGGDKGSDAELERATTTFFQQIDWAAPTQVILAATNFHDELDPALRRRLTTQIAFTLPDRDARRRMLERWFARAGFEPELLEELAEVSEGDSGADLRSRAMARARREFIRRNPVVEERPTTRRTREVSVLHGTQQLLRALEEAK